MSESTSTNIDEILIVDDTTANLELLTDIPTRAGYKIRPASSGELALRSVKAKIPALILLDIKMPGKYHIFNQFIIKVLVGEHLTLYV